MRQGGFQKRPVQLASSKTYLMLEELRQRLQTLQKPPGIDDVPGLSPLGVEAIDDILGGGLARGALHEIAAASEAHMASAAGFVLGLSSPCPALCRASAPSRQDVDGRVKAAHDGRHLVWIAEDMAQSESGALYGPGFEAFGLRPERLVTVQAARKRDLLWAMEEALHCRAITAVIGEMRDGEIDSVAVRRLSLAAAESGALALLLRATPPTDASTAATRWLVGASPSFVSVIPGRERSERARNPETSTVLASGFRVPASGRPRNDIGGIGSESEHVPCFAVSLTRNRRGPTGSWILQWSDIDERFRLTTHAQPVATPLLDRPHSQVA
jgi:protein ImuA